MLITKKEVKKQYGGLEDLQKKVVSRIAVDIIEDPLMTRGMKAVIAGLILFTDLSKYDG